MGCPATTNDPKMTFDPKAPRNSLSYLTPIAEMFYHFLIVVTRTRLVISDHNTIQRYVLYAAQVAGHPSILVVRSFIGGILRAIALHLTMRLGCLRDNRFSSSSCTIQLQKVYNRNYRLTLDCRDI